MKPDSSAPDLYAASAAKPFPDNWSYLKAELAWLDRVLMRAMAKQRQTNHDVDRVARSAADKASSHWWKGFITLDPARGGGSQVKSESEPANLPAHVLGRYGDRIAVSLEQNIRLAIPLLCQRLNLSKFERDLLVLCLAPEISRRYEKLYAFLNNDEANCKQPTVDLALRLFCRSDEEWRTARATLHPQAPLLQFKILDILPSTSSARSLLARSVQLSDRVVDFLLSENLPLDAIAPQPRTDIPTTGKAKSRKRAGGNWIVIGEKSASNSIKQFRDDASGAAAAEMLLRQSGITTIDQFAIYKEARVSASETGRDLINLAQAMNKLAPVDGKVWQGGYFQIPGMSSSQILNVLVDTGESWAAEFRGALMRLGHMIVVDGIDRQGRVLVRDPWKATSYKISSAEFLNYWNGRGIVIQNIKP